MLIFIPSIENGGVLGQDGDAALALQFVGVHHALDQSLVGAESAALAEHGIHQRGLTVVDVGDDGDVANTGAQIGPFRWQTSASIYHFTMAGV